MMMTSALDVDAKNSAAAYQKFHADWAARVAAEADLLRRLKADFVFANVGYLPLAGAQLADIHNAAMCSLNWYDIYRHYCGDDAIAQQIHLCYAHADAFLRTTPGMAMDNLSNVIPIAPIADLGANKRDKLNRRLQLSHEEKLVLVSMGGITSRLPMENWPRMDGIKFLVQENWQVQRADCMVLESLNMSFSDLLASSDALLCKPGYGSFVEASGSGIPVLYVDRGDWPESPALEAWLAQHSACKKISREQAEQGDFHAELHSLLQLPRAKNTSPSGAAQVADWLAQRLA